MLVIAHAKCLLFQFDFCAWSVFGSLYTCINFLIIPLFDISHACYEFASNMQVQLQSAVRKCKAAHWVLYNTPPPFSVKLHIFSLIIENNSRMHTFTHSTTVRGLNVKHFKQIQMQWIIHDAEDKFLDTNQ